MLPNRRRPPEQPPACKFGGVSGLACVHSWIHDCVEILKATHSFTDADPFRIYVRDQWAIWLGSWDT